MLLVRREVSHIGACAERCGPPEGDHEYDVRRRAASPIRGGRARPRGRRELDGLRSATGRSGNEPRAQPIVRVDRVELAQSLVLRDAVGGERNDCAVERHRLRRRILCDGQRHGRRRPRRGSSSCRNPESPLSRGRPTPSASPPRSVPRGRSRRSSSRRPRHTRRTRVRPSRSRRPGRPIRSRSSPRARATRPFGSTWLGPPAPSGSMRRR